MLVKLKQGFNFDIKKLLQKAKSFCNWIKVQVFFVQSPLQNVCWNWLQKCLKFLLENEAKVDEKNKINQTAYDVALKERRVECARLLENFGKQVDQKSQ